jgi:cellulose synthase/poly-beta-1,6-N-acetylglucosamine synthase-like glycosyltransferase
MRHYEAILHGLTALKSLSVLGLDVVLSIVMVFVLYKHLKAEKISWRSYLLYAMIFLNFVALAGLDLIIPNWNLPLLTFVMIILTTVSALMHWIYPIPSVCK